MSRIVLKHTRTLDDGDQKYNLNYCLLEDETPKQLYITASLKMTCENGSIHESKSNVPVPCREFGEHLFALLSNAQDPVFPIHMPEIVRDQAIVSVDRNSFEAEVKDPQSR